MKIVIIFMALSIVNVIGSTIRSLLTINGNKTVASLSNALYFAFYNIVMVYTVADFPLLTKCVITFICNLIGVYIVKLFEEKSKKDMLWKVELTIPTVRIKRLCTCLDELGFSYSTVNTNNKYIIVNVYCKTQNESLALKEVIKKFDVKYFATESKIL